MDDSNRKLSTHGQHKTDIPTAKGRLLKGANTIWCTALLRNTSFTSEPSMGWKNGSYKLKDDDEWLDTFRCPSKLLISMKSAWHSPEK